MNIVSYLTTLFLSLWLILTGVLFFIKFKIPYIAVILPALAVASGILLLITGEKPSGRFGLLLLGIYLLISGIMPYVKITVPGLQIILPLLAAVSGVLILLRK